MNGVHVGLIIWHSKLWKEVNQHGLWEFVGFFFLIPQESVPTVFIC